MVQKDFLSTLVASWYHTNCTLFLVWHCLLKIIMLQQVCPSICPIAQKCQETRISKNLEPLKRPPGERINKLWSAPPPWNTTQQWRINYKHLTCVCVPMCVIVKLGWKKGHSRIEYESAYKDQKEEKLQNICCSETHTYVAKKKNKGAICI